MAVVLPTTVAPHLVRRIKAVHFQQTLGETQRHGGIVGPSAARQLPMAAAEQIGKRRELPGLAKLQ
jgi:hypothetical protein